MRKAHGGSVFDIVGLFAAEFAKLVLLASLVAWPTAYVVTQRWLAGFAYRVELSTLVFARSSALTLLLACITVGAVAARAASAKPRLALRHE